MTQPASPYGVTLWTGVNQFGQLDVDATGLLVTGVQLVAQRLVLRQTTPQDSCADAPNDCFDVRDWLSSGMTDAQVAQWQCEAVALFVCATDTDVVAQPASVTECAAELSAKVAACGK